MSESPSRRPAMIAMQPIGTVKSPYTDTAQIPKGPGAEHRAEGVLEIRPQFEAGLQDIEGFSHLYVLWVFDRAEGFDLLATPPTTYILLRTASDPSGVAGAARRRLQALDPDLSVTESQPLHTRFARALIYPRFVTLLMGTFAGIALVLAAVGVYGVIAYGVARRTREIGIQMVLGAARGEVLRAVIGRAMKLVLAGVALGIVGSLAITPVLGGLLAGVPPGDPATLAAMGAVLAVTGLVASYPPARRATAVVVTESLRAE